MCGGEMVNLSFKIERFLLQRDSFCFQLAESLLLPLLSAHLSFRPVSLVSDMLIVPTI